MFWSQVKGMANPFAYEEYRKGKIRQKIDQSRIQRVNIQVGFWKGFLHFTFNFFVNFLYLHFLYTHSTVVCYLSHNSCKSFSETLNALFIWFNHHNKSTSEFVYLTVVQR